jgi:hypothetical protein
MAGAALGPVAAAVAAAVLCEPPFSNLLAGRENVIEGIFAKLSTFDPCRQRAAG